MPHRYGNNSHGITQCYLPPGRGDIPALVFERRTFVGIFEPCPPPDANGRSAVCPSAEKKIRISYPKNRRFRQGRIKTKLRLMLQLWCRVDSAKGRARLCRPPTFCMLFYMLPVFFDTDQSHSTPRCAEIQPISQQSAAASRNVSVSIHALLLYRAVDAVLGLCR